MKLFTTEYGLVNVLGSANYFEAQTINALLDPDLLALLCATGVEVQAIKVVKTTDHALQFSLLLEISREDLDHRIEELTNPPKKVRKKK